LNKSCGIPIDGRPPRRLRFLGRASVGASMTAGANSVSRDNLDDEPATIRMTLRRRWG